MPTEACQFFYECTHCKKILRPKPGDCCVYCSYGDRPLSRQTARVVNNNLNLAMRPNQSLKLTEPAVDDFAARCWTDLALLIGTSAQQPTLRRLFAAAA